MSGLFVDPSALQLALGILVIVCVWLWWRLHKSSEENDGLQREFERVRQKYDHLQQTVVDRKEQQDTAFRQLQQTSKEREDTLAAELRQLRDELDDTRSEKRQLETQQQNDREKLTFLEEAERRMGVTFKDVASNVLQETRVSLVQTIDQNQENAKQDLQHRQQAIREMVNPISQKLQELHNANVSMQASFSTSLNSLADVSSGLRDETNKLVNALRRPEVRGRWGEVELERCVELAGMDEHVLWESQVPVGNGARRPDLVVTLPNNRQVIVDAKTPIDAYLSAIEAQDDASRKEHLQRHAKHVRTSMDELSSKKYWESFPHSPDFVIMFIPGEAFYSAALQQDRALLETSIDKRVIIASPTNLIALLLIIQLGWREVQLAKEAEEIGELGRELYKRAGTLMNAIIDIRKGLNNNVNAYNKAVGSLNNYIPQVKRLGEFRSIRGTDLPEPEPYENEIRLPRQHVLPDGQDNHVDD